jgi:hypothetical protein
VGNDAVNNIDPSGLEIFVGQHGAFFPANPLNHAAIVLRPDNPKDFANNPLFANGAKEVTLGAQAFGPGVTGLFGGLESKPNYPGDSSSSLKDLTKVNRPANMSDTQFINAVLDASSRYKNNLRYDPVPDPWGLTYNSNSFVSGVLKAAGTKAPDLPGVRPGYNQPIPIPKK